MAANVTYDLEVDAMTISFGAAAGAAVEGEEVRPGVVLHFDAADRLVAIEVLHASETLTDGALALLQPAAE